MFSVNVTAQRLALESPSLYITVNYDLHSLLLLSSNGIFKVTVLELLYFSTIFLQLTNRMGMRE